MTHIGPCVPDNCSVIMSLDDFHPPLLPFVKEMLLFHCNSSVELLP